MALEIRLGCLSCNRDDHDGIDSIPLDWSDVEQVQSYAKSIADVDPDDPLASVLDWPTHVGICPECQEVSQLRGEIEQIREANEACDNERVIREAYIVDLEGKTAALRVKNDRLDWRITYCEDGQSTESNEARQELERLRSENAKLIAYLESELAHWDGRNADRWWQTRRILGHVQKLPEG